MAFHPEFIIVHCTATPTHIPVDAAWVDRVHRQEGWSMCGYHEVITRAGERQNAEGGFPTRRLNQVGSHVGGCGLGWNSRCIGISLAGGVTRDGKPEDNFTSAQKIALREALIDYTNRFGIGWQNILGHRDLIKITHAAPKACPCFSVSEWLHGIRFDKDFEPGTDAAQPGTADPGTLTAVPNFALIGQPHGTLYALSRAYGVPVDTIKRMNPGLDPLRLQHGQAVRLRDPVL